MNRNAIFLSTVLALAAAGCGGTASAPANSNTAAANANSNPTLTANVNPNTNNPIANATPEPIKEGKIPGIPDMPGTEKPIPKNDPTLNAKPQQIKSAAPDNSEVTTSLDKELVRTRTFKSNPRIAKVEVFGTDGKLVKVYLKNGQVRELPPGKVADPLVESADNIFKALGGDAAAPTKVETDAPKKP